MKRNRAWILCGVAVWLNACATTLPRKVPPDTPAEVAAAAVYARRIGVTRRPGACPVPASRGWAVRPLFPLAELDQDLRRSAHRAGLDRYCVYEYQGPDPRPELPQEIAERLHSAEPDRVALTSAAAPSLEDMTWRSFAQRFYAQVPTPSPAVPAGTDPPHVRLAILDTQRTEKAIPKVHLGLSSHCYTLTHIAGYLARWQGRSSASVEIVSQLALPVVNFDKGQETRSDEGGWRGTFESLASAIWREVLDWQLQSQPRPEHLVLNLSVGWDEKFGGEGTDIAKMSPDVRAVYDALVFAADQGVLVIAAAGNGRPLTHQLPLLPAGWETRQWPSRNGRPPLVYAVSGVDGRNLPLVNTRERGEAPRVAYADHVAVSDYYNAERPTAILTGTSVATTVVATTAALVWQYRPELAPEEVMELLYQSGQDLSRLPDFALPSVGAVRRISLCPALSRACDQPGASCQAPLCDSSNLSGLPGLIDPPPSPPLPWHTIDGASLLPGQLDLTSPYFFDGPWVNPQPGADPCPPCNLTLDTSQSEIIARADGIVRASLSAAETSAQFASRPLYKLQAEIPLHWNELALKGGTLEIFEVDAMGNKASVNALSFGIGPGNWLEVTNLDFGTTQNTFQAILSFTLEAPDGTTSVIQSPLYVEP